MADLQKYKPLLHDNPLCGIDTYKDTLNLATGACTRKIKKLVLTGEETGIVYSGTTGIYYIKITNGVDTAEGGVICTHYICQQVANAQMLDQRIKETKSGSWGDILAIKDTSFADVTALKTFLATEYAAGHPVTVWYVLATPTTETITVPSGLSGIEEGYLNQSGTPTPTNPIYPTANEVLIWQHSLRKLSTATDTLTTLPVDLYADGNNATVGLKGNTTQSGTPTPDNPIMPQGTGERTANLLLQKLTGVTIDSSGKIVSDANYDTYIAEVSDGETYTVSNVTGVQVLGFFTTKPTLGAITYNSSRTIFSTSSQTLTVPTGENIKYISVRYNTGVSNAMLNSGSTALPYEPYGYKIPISSNSTTTPVYLGEVETTRRIRKSVLTGEEQWEMHTSVMSLFRSVYINDYLFSESNIILCTHYRSIVNTGAAGVSNGETCFYYNTASTARIIYIKDETFTSAAAFKSYLAQQYAAGTPVTVWYVLATEETGIVNEPLMKIGDYADEVSNVSIPVTAGGDTLSVDATVQPSEVTVNYKGWHPVADVHERESGQWD